MTPSTREIIPHGRWGVCRTEKRAGDWEYDSKTQKFERVPADKRGR